MDKTTPQQGSTETAVANPMFHLRYIMKRLPDIGQKVNHFRQYGIPGYLTEWPEWMFLPSECFGIILEKAMGSGFDEKQFLVESPVLATLATWRYCQGVYQFEPNLMARLAAMDINEAVPAAQFLRLPQWCVYIETPGMDWFGKTLYGFWTHLIWDKNNQEITLALMLDTGGELRLCMLDIGDWSFLEGVSKPFERSRLHAQVVDPDWMNTDDVLLVARELMPLIAMTRYLCSDSADIVHATTPGLRPTNPTATKTKHGLKLFPAPKPTIWHVGKNLRASLH